MSNFTVLINFLTKIPLSKGRTKEDNANPDLNNFFTVLFLKKKPTFLISIELLTLFVKDTSLRLAKIFCGHLCVDFWIQHLTKVHPQIEQYLVPPWWDKIFEKYQLTSSDLVTIFLYNNLGSYLRNIFRHALEKCLYSLSFFHLSTQTISHKIIKVHTIQSTNNCCDDFIYMTGFHDDIRQKFCKA